MDPKIKDPTLLLTDAELILQECRDLKTYLALELQAARDDRKAQQKQFREFMSKLWQTLRRIQAQFKVDAQLLNLLGQTQSKHDRNRDNESKIYFRQPHNITRR